MAITLPSLPAITSFDATVGRQINYNASGGTVLIRSSKLYIYDNTNGSLICTHIDNTTYTSANPYHTLPLNTDSTIIYESGKSSTDFANGKYLAAQIQVFSGVGATGEASGLSEMRDFWCLNTPSLVFNAIDSPINTTSYNFSANYDSLSTGTGVPTNEIQSYQFLLYNSGSNQQVASSGQIVGSGTTTGPTTSVISYNFTGLQDRQTYYCVIQCVTTSGMAVTAQSATVTIDISTVQFVRAQVENVCEDGYISIQCNVTNIPGKTNVETPIEELLGYIDLRGDKYVIWDNGFSFPSSGRWTAQLRGRAFEKSPYISSDLTNTSFIIRLEGGGTISIFITSTYPFGSTTLQTKVDLLAEGVDGVEYYTYSDYVPTPTDIDEFDMWIRCIDGLYEVSMNKLN